MVTFREILKEGQQKGDTDLLMNLEEMETASKEWMPSIYDEHGVHAGYPHVVNVETNIDRAVPDHIKETLSYTEIFVLLASVLVHDLGKGGTDKEHQKDHGKISCVRILEERDKIKIPTLELARWCAIVACSHTWQEPYPDKECHFRGNGCYLKCTPKANGIQPYCELYANPSTTDGPVRLDRLACLLRIGDEVDNSKYRAIPEWLANINNKLTKEGGKSKNTEKLKEWRKRIDWILFDQPGSCIRFRCSSLDEGWKRDSLDRLAQALNGTNEVLKHWKPLMLKIGLEYDEAFIDVSHPSPALFKSKDVVKNKNRRQGHLESSLRPEHLKRIAEAMLRLIHGVIYADFIGWEAIAVEAGIKDIEYIKLALNRIQSIYIGDGNQAFCNRYYKWIKKIFAQSRLGDDLSKINIVLSNKGVEVRSFDCKEDKTQLLNLPREAFHGPETIDTGINVLNHLLCPERPVGTSDYSRHNWQGGFYAPSSKVESCSWFPPIIAIEGSSGEGKSTLSMQISWNLVYNKKADDYAWLCLFYTLEQEPERLLQNLDSYNYFSSMDEKVDDSIKFILNLDRQAWSHYKESEFVKGKLILPRLSPKHSVEGRKGLWDLFDLRYRELFNAIRWSYKVRQSLIKKKVKIQTLFIIDSLGALANQSLERDQLHQLFALFRTYKVPLIVTLERQKHWAKMEDEVHFNHARYLSDVVVSLASSEKDGYYRQTIEVSKTRYNRRILGKHQMKLKSPHHQTTRGVDDRCGVVIYPSIHRYYSMSREKLKSQPSEDRILINRELLPINSSLGNKNEEQIKSDTCIAVTGPFGGHKLALAMNLLMCRKPSKPKVIISLAEEAEINIKGVAFIPSVYQEWKDYLEKRDIVPSELISNKLSVVEFGKVTYDEGTCFNKMITLVNFRAGQIMAEEFLYIIESILDKDKSAGFEDSIDGVLFADTALMRTCFPGLAKDPLFLSAFVDIIKSRGLFSVFIDVEDMDGKPSQELLAASDIRIFVEHKEGYGDPVLHVDNVRGKVYDRRYRRIYVNDKSKESTLEISSPFSMGEEMLKVESEST